MCYFSVRERTQEDNAPGKTPASTLLSYVLFRFLSLIWRVRETRARVCVCMHVFVFSIQRGIVVIISEENTPIKQTKNFKKKKKYEHTKYTVNCELQ